MAPELYRGAPDMTVFQRLVNEPSSVEEHAPREGIVIRDPSLELLDGQLPIAKFKQEAFREKDYHIPVEDFMRLADEAEKVQVFVRMFVTEARLKKMADVLREQGTLTRSLQDIPALTAELLKDIQAEDAAYYAAFDQRMVSRSLAQKVNQLFPALLNSGDWINVRGLKPC